MSLSNQIQWCLFEAEIVKVCFWRASKSTCFWLKNLPHLTPTNIVDKGEFFEWVDKNGKKKRQAQWYMDALKKAKTPEQRRTLRSKTFQGIAKAMATQWTK